MGTIRQLGSNLNIIGTNLKHIREERGLSQLDLCCKLELLVYLCTNPIYMKLKITNGL